MPDNEGYLLRAGYADGLMAVFLIASILALHRYVSSKNKLDIFMCALCAVAAAYTKQPALLWSLFSLPVIFLSLALKKEEDMKLLILAAIFSILLSLLWALFIGAGFENNQDAINRSLASKTYFSNFINSFTLYFINESKVGVLILIVTLICIFRKGIYLAILLLFIIPAIIAWFVFGAYEIRLGYHIILLSIAYLVINLVLGIHQIIQHRFMQKPKMHLFAILLGVAIFSIAATKVYRKGSDIFQKQLSYSQLLFAGNIDFKKSKEAYLRFVFEDGFSKAKEIYDSPSQQNILVGTNYVHQAFYIKHNVYRLNPRQNGEPKAVLTQIKTNDIDYTINSDLFTHEPLRNGTNELKSICPQLFEEILGKETNHFKMYIDKVHKDKIRPCLELLHEK